MELTNLPFTIPDDLICHIAFRVAFYDHQIMFRMLNSAIAMGSTSKHMRRALGCAYSRDWPGLRIVVKLVMRKRDELRRASVYWRFMPLRANAYDSRAATLLFEATCDVWMGSYCDRCSIVESSARCTGSRRVSIMHEMSKIRALQRMRKHGVLFHPFAEVDSILRRVMHRILVTLGEPEHQGSSPASKNWTQTRITSFMNIIDD